jgi:hypothetical protein
MVAQTATALRRPNKPGFMAPYTVSEMADAVAEIMGEENLSAALKEAQLFRMPSAGEPVREDKAARLHQALRTLWPEKAADICMMAGRATAHQIIDMQITEHAQAMRSKMPRNRRMAFGKDCAPERLDV